jgi:hypothetical protein
MMMMGEKEAIKHRAEQPKKRVLKRRRASKTGREEECRREEKHVLMRWGLEYRQTTLLYSNQNRVRLPTRSNFSALDSLLTKL